MKERKFPVLVSTYKGLCLALRGQCSLIFVEEVLHSQRQEQIEITMELFGYVKSDKPGNRGTLYIKHLGANRFRSDVEVLYDPLGILVKDK